MISLCFFRIFSQMKIEFERFLRISIDFSFLFDKNLILELNTSLEKSSFRMLEQNLMEEYLKNEIS